MRIKKRAVDFILQVEDAVLYSSAQLSLYDICDFSLDSAKRFHSEKQSVGDVSLSLCIVGLELRVFSGKHYFNENPFPSINSKVIFLSSFV